LLLKFQWVSIFGNLDLNKVDFQFWNKIFNYYFIEIDIISWRPHLIQVFILKPPSLWTALIWLFISPLLTVSKPHLSKLLLEPNFTICPSASFPKILKYYQNLIKQFIIFIFLVKSSYSRTTTSVEPSKVCHPYITVGKSSFMNSSYMFSKLLFISVVFPANIT